MNLDSRALLLLLFDTSEGKPLHITMAGKNNTTAYEVESDQFNVIDQGILAIFFIFVTIFGVTGNLSVLYAILSNKSNCNIPSSTYFVGLAISDLLLSLISGVYNTSTIINHGLLPSSINEVAFCKFIIFVQYFLAFVGILSVAAVSVDRYLAILHPFWYEKRVTKQVVCLVNIYVWVQAFLFSLPAPIIKDYILYEGLIASTCGFQWDKANFAYVILVMFANFLVPAVVTMFTNCKVFSVARSQHRKIRANVMGIIDRAKMRDFDTGHSQLSLNPSSISPDNYRPGIAKRMSIKLFQISKGKGFKRTFSDASFIQPHLNGIAVKETGFSGLEGTGNSCRRLQVCRKLAWVCNIKEVARDSTAMHADEREPESRSHIFEKEIAADFSLPKESVHVDTLNECEDKTDRVNQPVGSSPQIQPLSSYDKQQTDSSRDKGNSTARNEADVSVDHSVTSITVVSAGPANSINGNNSESDSSSCSPEEVRDQRSNSCLPIVETQELSCVDRSLLRFVRKPIRPLTKFRQRSKLFLKRASTLHHRKRREWKIAFSTLSLVVSCFVAWAPFTVVRLLAMLFNKHISWRILSYTGSFTFISSVWDPFFVLATRNDYRRALRKKRS